MRDRVGTCRDEVSRSSLWKFIVATIVLLIVTVLCLQIASAAELQDAFDLATTDVTILDTKSLQVIGHGHYQVTRRDGAVLFEGENRYLDGEYDREVQHAERSAGGAPPILMNYRHSFFAADGSLESLDTLDAKTGIVACTLYDGAGSPVIRQTKIEVPSDTYAGSSQLMLLVGQLRRGAREITLHSFICFPGPRIVPIRVTPPATTMKWAMYPGDLMKVELAPDLGWIGTVAAPLIPKSYGWFDPADDFNYVGGIFDRFYRRRHLMMVREVGSRP